VVVADGSECGVAMLFFTLLFGKQMANSGGSLLPLSIFFCYVRTPP
jgi:hypothetical protein